MSTLPNTELGCPIPFGIPHAISSSLRRWEYIDWWADHDERLLSKVTSDYPRFIVHTLVRQLCQGVVSKYCRPDEECRPFPSHTAASNCSEFVRSHAESAHPERVRLLKIGPISSPSPSSLTAKGILPLDESAIQWGTFWVAVFHRDDKNIAHQVWQHRGEGLSSRHTEFCLSLFQRGYLAAHDETGAAVIERSATKMIISQSNDAGLNDPVVLPDGIDAVDTIRRRIAALASVERKATPVLPEDVFLYPSGMSAIAHGVDALCSIFGRENKFAIIGTTYSDTRPVIEKFGPGCIYYGGAFDSELDDLEQRLQGGERITALYCETPGNPMLTTPDLNRIKRLSIEYDFVFVIDETVGTWVNVDALKYADMTCTSLSKSFSGGCNVLGGCIVLNRLSVRYYPTLLKTFTSNYIPEYFPLDAIIMEQNSRDFAARVRRMNSNAETLAAFLHSHPAVKEVRYPTYITPEKYAQVRRQQQHGAERKAGEGPGNSMLLSIIFRRVEDAAMFYDHLECAKGATLGTNFTLANAFVLMAMKARLDQVRKYGLVPETGRVSVGLEDPQELIKIFGKALDVVVDSWAKKRTSGTMVSAVL